ncbi:MAG: primosomal protein N', partial [Clostridia bacterium]|nr:primosomal protein N' [Clostridia bacterium]
MYANIVVLENKSKFTDNLFTYDCGELSLSAGDRVLVPFGKEQYEGYVFELSDTTDVPENIIKPVISRMDCLHLTPEIVKTCEWMRKRYGIKYFDALHMFIPNGKAPKEGKEKKPLKDVESEYVKPLALTAEQQHAADTIGKSIDEGKRDIFLIHGVTSSGKTEVYMDAIERVLSVGKTAIMLVPEISLTAQMVERFAGRFGKESIAILHSRLTGRERYDEWTRIRNGEAKIVIGARMAVFSPLTDIGVIILDEEHESTYKSDMNPKYETVDIAAKRLMTYDGVLILGSATPSVTSYKRAQDGTYRLLELKKRYNETPLPEVEICDMRKEVKDGNTTLLSSRLYDLMSENLSKGKQVILLQNRRGYSNYVSCSSCGHVVKCPECGISLTYHKTENRLICHYCGKKFSVPKICPECESRYIKYVGTGTEQVEEFLKDRFPDKTVERLDLDISVKKSEVNRILKSFRKKETDILVGTQIIAKGLDFDNVGLVGVINADVTLNIPDYRSAERTYQLLTQVAGRAGRGSEQGKVLIQTSEPQNFIFSSVKNHDYDGFVRNELDIRSYMEYPPFGDLIVCNFTSKKEDAAEETAERAKQYMINAIGKDG